MTDVSFSAPLELKFVAETGVFEGYASVFHVVDSVGDRIVPGAFSDSLVEFRREGRFPPMLWQHDTGVPIGKWRDMHEDEHGLYVKGELFVNDLPAAREAHKLLREKVVTGLSIGYRARGFHHDRKSGVRVLTGVDLVEVSLVTFPANVHARVSVVQNDDAEEAEIRRLTERVWQATRELRAQKSAVWPSDAGIPLDELVAIRALTCRVWAAVAEIKSGFDPSQPRDSGGQWVDGGGSAGGQRIQPLPTRRPRSMDDLRRYEGDGLGHPLSPLDFIGGAGVARAAARILKPLAGLGASEASATAEALAARAARKPLAAHESNAKIRQAADAIEEYLGGQGKVIRNKYEDVVFIRGDKKVRFDINKTGLKPDRVTPEDPHFQFEERTKHGNWRSSGDKHRYPFKKE